MQREPNDPLARWAEQALKQLPARRAPAALAPRVLAAIRLQAARPWYRRPWMTWPRGYQASSALLGTAIFWAAGRALFQVRSAAEPVVADLRGEASVVTSVLKALGQALQATVAQVPWWFWAGAVAMVLSAWIACLGLGTACWRLSRSPR